MTFQEIHRAEVREKARSLGRPERDYNPDQGALRTCRNIRDTKDPVRASRGSTILLSAFQTLGFTEDTEKWGG